MLHEDIDLLVGITTYAEIIETGIIKGKPNEAIALKTKFGWIIGGGQSNKWTTNVTHIITNDSLMNQIKKNLGIGRNGYDKIIIS